MCSSGDTLSSEHELQIGDPVHSRSITPSSEHELEIGDPAHSGSTFALYIKGSISYGTAPPSPPK
jgi:hypothetical protein